jgi:phycoerythrin beta chain
MRKILVDDDIILEYLVNREEFRIEAGSVWEMIESKRIEVFITESGLEKIHLYIGQLANSNNVKKIIDRLKKTMKICPINKGVIRDARTMNLRNFEAAIKVICAIQMDLDAILAWNPKDFFPDTYLIKVLSIYQLFALELAEVYEEKKGFPSQKALAKLSQSFNEGNKRLNIINIIASRASLITKDSVRQMIDANKTLILPGGNCYHSRRMAACLRDTDIILRYVTYALLTDDASILQDRCLNGLKETYSALGVPIDASIYSVNIMRENIIDLINQLIHNSQLEISTTDGDYSSTIEELNRYFDMIVSALY